MPRTEPQRVVIYARVSVDRGSKSVDDQITECRETAEKEGWTVVDAIPESGSASRHARKSRERWSEAAALIESGQVDMLMTWEFSRATRELGFYVALRDACSKAKCLWWYGGTVYDMSKREDRFRTGMDALMAEDEADRTSERVNRGMRSSAHRAVANQGRPAYGYRSVYDRATGQLQGRELDPETAPIVREVAERILGGETLLSICRDLNDRGIPTPKGTEWNQTKLRLMISRPALAGLRVFQGQVHGQAQWEPILTVEQHQQLLAKFSDPRRRTSRDGSVKHLLTGIAICGVCGGAMRQIMNRNRYGARKPKYRCRNCGLSRSQEFVDEIVSRAVVMRLSRPDARELFTPDHSDDVRQAREDLARLKARLEECYRQAEADDPDERLSPLGLARMERSLEPKITQAEAKLRSAHLSPLVARALDGGPEEVWADLDVIQRREIVRELVTVTIDPTVRGPYFDPRSVRVEWRSPAEDFRLQD